MIPVKRRGQIKHLGVRITAYKMPGEGKGDAQARQQRGRLAMVRAGGAELSLLDTRSAILVSRVPSLSS